MSSQLGPITKDTTYTPSFTINTFPVTYVTNGNTCTASATTVGTKNGTTSSALSYIYNYGTNLPNSTGDGGFDVTCTKSGKTFIGWNKSKTGTTASSINIQNSETIYPVFADKSPVTVYIGDLQVYQTFVDPDTNVTATDIRREVLKKIDEDNLSNKHNISSNDSTLPLYTSSDCKSTFTSGEVPAKGLTLYIKPDPWITFSLGGITGVTFKDGSTTSKKIALSKLKDGEAAPSILIDDKIYKEFDGWRTNLPLYSSLSPLPNNLTGINITNYNEDAIYTVSLKDKQFTVTFYDQHGECGKNTNTNIKVIGGNIITTANYPDYAALLNCKRDGSTFEGWKENENFTPRSYCPTINILFYIVMIVIIAIIVKHICNKMGIDKVNNISSSITKRSI